MVLDDLPQDSRIAGRATEVVGESDAERAEDGEEGVGGDRGRGGGGGVRGVERPEADAEQNPGRKKRPKHAITGGKDARRRVPAEHVHVHLAGRWKRTRRRTRGKLIGCK